uniref:Uncharacterized protein n=2 Tax=Oryza glaberrima TaxID=4538 RepID=I1R8S7_ORYGL
MEQQKWRYLRSFRNRYQHRKNVSTSVALDDIVGEVRKVNALVCYSERTGICDDNNDDFVEMLLLDGCFILELLFRWAKPGSTKQPDPLREVGWVLNLLQSDLILLENQIPFAVLRGLYTLINGSDRLLVELVLQFLKSKSTFLCTPPDPNNDRPQFDHLASQDFHHLLHLFNDAYVPGSRETASSSVPEGSLEVASPGFEGSYETAPSPVPEGSHEAASSSVPEGSLEVVCTSAPAPLAEGSDGAASTTVHERRNGLPPLMKIPSVSELLMVGVKFEMSPGDITQITFDVNKGIMKMPRIVIDQAGLPLLINLVAFEQSRGHRAGTREPLTSYVALMSSLIKSGEDVSILQRSGIIVNLLSDDDEAAINYFSRLGQVCTINYRDNLFAELFNHVNRYHEHKWNKHLAKFKRDYCNSPQSFAAFLVGIILTLASVFGAVMAGCNYFKPKK